MTFPTPPPPSRALALGIAAGTLLALSSCTDYYRQRAAVAPAAPGTAIGTGGEQAAPPPAPPKHRTNYPLATPLPSKKGHVISPFKPYNVIEVKGFSSGHLARDPSTAPIDPSTGKPDLSKAKIFEIP